MGPTNISLVKLFRSDQQLRIAQDRLNSAAKNVRQQERRVADLDQKLKEAQTSLRERQAHAANLELDLKTREAHIEKLRTQQQTAKTNKEYQAFLIEINTGKVDRGKVEEEAMAALEAAEQTQQEVATFSSQLQTEQAKLKEIADRISETLINLQAEVESLRPERDQASAALPPGAREAFERLAAHHEGEAMAAIAKPDRRREEYLCTACNMDLVTDVYNKLHSRDELVFCPSCRRILYIPDDLPPELGVHKPKEKKEKAKPEVGASSNRQSDAADVLRSVQVDGDQVEAG